MLRSRKSGGRLVRSKPRQNTRSTPRPRSMQKGGVTKSAPRKMQFGSTPQCRKGWVYSSDEGRCTPIEEADPRVRIRGFTYASLDSSQYIRHDDER